MMFFQEGSITTNALDIEAGINFANGGYITAEILSALPINQVLMLVLKD